MAISSINSNLAAILAQINISNATTATSNDVAALSSGNRIVSASTDVAALAAGTGLQSQVNVLTSSISVAAQGSSLLQVADGGLAQIQSILQRQQAITTSAESGSLSSTQLGFLNQEFQALTTEINNIANQTNFNGVNLLNGSIQGGANITTNSNNGNANKSAAVTIATVGTVDSANDYLTVSVGGGPAVTITTTTGTTSGDVAIGGGSATVTTEAQNIVAALNNSGDPQLANFRFTNNAGAIQAYYVGPATNPLNIPTITTGGSAHFTGTGTIATNTLADLGSTATNGSGLIATFSAASVAAQDTVTVNGVTFSAVASPASSVQFTAGTAIATATNLAAVLNAYTATNALSGITFAADGAGDLYGYYNSSTTPTVTLTVTQGGTGTIATSAKATNQTLVTTGYNGLSAGTTAAIGTVTGNLFVTGGTNVSASTANVGQAVDLSNVNSNAAFTGSFGGANIGAIQATYDAGSSVSASGVTLSTVVGGITYTAAEVLNSTLIGTGPNAITFVGSNGSSAQGGSFTLNILGSQSSITNQTQASQFATALNAGLANVAAYQTRGVSSYNNAYTTTVGGSQIATLQDSSLSYSSNDFSTTPIVSSVSVSAPSTGSTDAKITAVVNGQTYSTIAGIGNTFNTNSEIVLENTSNPSQQIILTTGSTAATGNATGVAINLSTASNASAFQTTLSNALGLNSSTNAGLSFQVGTSSTNTLGVTLGSATSSALFGGVAQDVLTSGDASTAAAAVTTALNTVTALRATVGANEEQFTFASSALSSASQNESAAASNLLDTNVASTSTTFATNQVQLQAGIAVLAQANQLQQNLLKLLA